MMQLESSMGSAELDDAGLVRACLRGERDAFARIVARYQSLVASISYSATGSIAQSEDLAQETFVAAWRGLKSLENPAKLRPWLCGIARRATANLLRRQRREPTQDSKSLDELIDAPAENALPVDHAISREEEAILWRSLQQIPKTYREPLILFYREDQSVDRVAEALELSPDAVRQRLSRGRKLLENQVASFVEGALRQSVPGRSFTAGVMNVLPAQIASASLASLGVTTAKGGAVKAAGWLAALSGLAGFLPGLVSSYQGYKCDMERVDSIEGRRAVRRFYAGLAACTITPVVLIFLAISFGSLALTHPTVFSIVVIAIALSWVPCAIILLSLLKQRGQAAAKSDRAKPAPVIEWRSKATFLGLPLVHFRHGGSAVEAQRPVKAWIAVGDVAIGGLFACGAVAIAPISFGGFALGAVVFAGFAVGILNYCGFGFGVWAIGGCVTAWNGVGGCVVAWNAALGGVALAQHFALGAVAVAQHANDAAAHQQIDSAGFFQIAFLLVTKWLWPTMLAAAVPSVLLSSALRRRARRMAQT